MQILCDKRLQQALRESRPLGTPHDDEESHEKYQQSADPESPQVSESARVALVHDAVPAARAGSRDIGGAIINEHRGRRLEREAPLGLGIDGRVRLHHPSNVGGKRAVADGVQAVLTR